MQNDRNNGRNDENIPKQLKTFHFIKLRTQSKQVSGNYPHKHNNWYVRMEAKRYPWAPINESECYHNGRTKSHHARHIAQSRIQK